jgi:dCMP deaminase
MTKDRLTWPEVWMNVAYNIAKRSYDEALQVGTVIVSDDNTQVLSVGYNGSYMGGPHKKESEIPGKSGFVHSELNALLKLDYNFPKKKIVYVTHSPCRMCSKYLINGGISRVVYDIPYRDTSGLDILESVGIEVLSLMEAISIARSK